MSKYVLLIGLLGAVGCASASDPQTENEEQGAKKCVQQVLCIQGYVWSAKSCRCVPEKTKASCTQDSDCRLFDDYCTGCDCRALGTHEKDPVCDGPGVRCFAEPCASHTAACVSGTCTVL